MPTKSLQHMLVLVSSLFMMVIVSMVFWMPVNTFQSGIVYAENISAPDFERNSGENLTDIEKVESYIKAQIAFHIQANQPDEAKKWYDMLRRHYE